MEEVLKIRIIGSLEGLDTASDAGVEALNKIEASANKTQGSLTNLSSALRAYGSNAGVVAQSSKSIANSLKSVSDSAGRITLKPLKISTEVDKISLPKLVADPVKIPVEIGKVNVPSVSIPPVKVPVEAGKFTIPAPSIPKVNIPVTADISSVTERLAAASKSIKISIDTAPAVASVSAVASSIKSLQATPFQIPVKVDAYQTAINKLKADLKSVKVSLPAITIPPIKNPVPADFVKNLEGAGAAATKSKTNFTGLSRVLQDLPFGFLGIQNNITQLLPAAGGLGLAISAVTAALTFSQVGFGAWTRGLDNSKAKLEEQKKKLEEAKQALSDYIESLDDITKVNVTGGQNAQEQLVSLQILYKATQDANVPLAERKRLVDELQEQYPKYFKNISDEIILAGGAASAYGKLANAILQSARAEAARQQIIEIDKELIPLEQQREQAIQDQAKAFQKLQSEQAKGLALAKRYTDEDRKNSLAIVNNGAAIGSAQGDYNKKLQASAALYDRISSLSQKATKLSAEVLKNVEQNGADVLIKPDIKIKEPKRDTSQFNFFDRYFDAAPARERLERQQSEMLDAVQDFAKKFQNKFPQLEDAFGEPNTAAIIAKAKEFWALYQKGLAQERPTTEIVTEIPLRFVGIVDPLKKIEGGTGLSAMDSLLKNFPREIKPFIKIAPSIDFNPDSVLKFIKKEDLKNNIEEALNDAMNGVQIKAFEGIGEALGAAISGGDISAVFQNMGAQIGGIVEALGEKIIALGVAGLAAKKAFASLLANPFAAIAAGIALTAIGVAFKNLTVPKLAGGGIIPGGYEGDRFPAFLNSGERVIPAGDWTQLTKAINMQLNFASLSSQISAPNFNGQALAPQIVVMSQTLRGRDVVLQNIRERQSQRRGG